jgi:hypothetical protein
MEQFRSGGSQRMLRQGVSVRSEMGLLASQLMVGSAQNQADLGKYGDEFKPGNDEKFTHRLERKV